MYGESSTIIISIWSLYVCSSTESTARCSSFFLLYVGMTTETSPSIEILSDYFLTESFTSTTALRSLGSNSLFSNACMNVFISLGKQKPENGLPIMADP